MFIVQCLSGGLGPIDEGFGQTYNKSKQSHLAWTMDGGNILHYINPVMPNGIFCPYQLGKSIMNLSVVG